MHLRCGGIGPMNNPILLTIAICEVGFWVLVIGGLCLRYVARMRRASTIVLALLPVLDLVLVAAVALDLHRGETVLVFSHGAVMSFCLPRLGRHVRDDLAAQMFLPNCAVAEVSIDADDVTILSWPGSADRSVV